MLQSLNRLTPLLKPFGTLSPQSPDEWVGDIPLPEVLADFYREVGPEHVEIDTIGDPFTFYPLSRLWDAQAGYRWNPNTGAHLVDWNEEWIVVARQGEDPFILDALTGAVLTAPGEDGWLDRPDEPEVTFPDLAAMVQALAAVGMAYARYEDPFTEDWNVKPELVNDVVAGLSTVMGDRAAASATARKFGYPA